jgi:RHS repeat-associated protein
VQIYDLNGHMLTETSQAAPPVETDYAYKDGMPIAAIQPAAATISALHTDLIGTVQKATDASKTLVWACNYNAFGACTPSPATITQNLRFPGMIADATGLYHWGFRDYNKTLGQGMQADPLGLAASFPGYPPATVNGYPYGAE